MVHSIAKDVPFWSTSPRSDSGVLTVGLCKGKESSEVGVNLLGNDIDQIKENIVSSHGYAAESVLLKAKKLEAKGKGNWRKILGTTKNAKGGCDICRHINSEFLWHTTLDSSTHAVLSLTILCTSFWPARESRIDRRWLT